MSYLLIAIAVTVLVITLAWRGLGTRVPADDSAPAPRPRAPRRTVAPDDDPEFLREVDRKLRGEDKSG